MQHAFCHVETHNQPFLKNCFYKQWFVGSIYATFSLFAKLTSKDENDNSLRKLWFNVVEFVKKDNACTVDELNFINNQFDNHARFSNKNSKATLYRNKVIAHNEKSISLEWDDIDKDIKILIRIWSILVSWASFGLGQPFRTNEQAFSGLEHFFDSTELHLLKVKRQEYINQAIHWSQTYLHSGDLDHGATAFTKIKVTTK
jgi:hypothetical protein